MRALRQRLLLVAGWVVAAVATGLVSAGAVAVAGGQVNDRPLNPLSAAEVAALPVVTADECGEEPPASGGYTLLLRCLDLAGSIGDTAVVDGPAQPAEKELPSGDAAFVADARFYDERATGGYFVDQPANAVDGSPR
jgi:hypothetical protein